MRRKGKRKEEEHELDDRLLAVAKPIWDGYLEQPFVKELGEGTLREDRFRFYMVQWLSLSFAVCEGICDGRGENRGRGTDDTLLLYGA